MQCDTCGATPWTPWITTNTTNTSYGFTWVGDNQGRWRITAIAADGTPGTPSGFRTFRYDTRLAGFVGTWHNVNPNTQNIPQATITQNSATNATLHLWGACTPSFCDWGTTSGTLSGGVLQGTFTFSFKVSTVRISKSGSQLVVRVHNHFTDNSGRADYDSTDTMNKG
ncbi:MAG: hypothetical protein AUI14_03365 [Actinobacteria bacterium 13_2_20CM_2_71_6]|nr:MAG: hypothetical protein AUI14_03365 [Actinobacteria bacterium 13_2_20CM_2_71_6]